jgi:hypothetical protein
MAELHVQRKKHALTWVWLVIIVAVVAGLVYLYLHYKNPPVSNKPLSSIQTKNISYVTV